MNVYTLASCITLALAGLLSGCSSTGGAAAARPGAAVAPAPARITVLYDAFGRDPALRKDWGYSAFIEAGGRRILFDTGNSTEVLEANARAKGVDLSRLDFVVMSHRHGDHMGGLAYLLRINPDVTIYAPKEGFGVYGSDLPSSFYRRDESLPAEWRYFGGQPPETLRFGAAWPQARFKLIDKTTEIAPGVHLIALVSDKPGTLELRELSLALDTPDGMVVVVGCSHPGIDRITEAAARINPRIALVAGGMHLVVAKDEEIARIATLLHDQYRVGWIAPGHCTGEPTFKALQAAFGDHDLYAGVGTRIELGSTPHLAAGQSGAPMAGIDFAGWRQLLAASDDAPAGEATRWAGR